MGRAEQLACEEGGEGREQRPGDSEGSDRRELPQKSPTFLSPSQCSV